ncbi:MAG: hypothetical protein AAFZ52_19615 [Bacteroidota bacterium]
MVRKVGAEGNAHLAFVTSGRLVVTNGMFALFPFYLYPMHVLIVEDEPFMPVT